MPVILFATRCVPRIGQNVANGEKSNGKRSWMSEMNLALAKMIFTRQQSDCILHISMEWNQGELPAAPGPPAAPAARPGPLPANAAQFPLSRNRKWAEVAAEEASTPPSI